MANPQNDTEEETASMNGMDTSMDGTTTENVNENATTETVSENATDSGNGINSDNIDNSGNAAEMVNKGKSMSIHPEITPYLSEFFYI